MPLTHPTIADAVSDNDCPAIQIAQGDYTESVLVTRPLQLEGIGRVTVRGDSSSVITTTAALTLKNLTLTGGTSDRGGGVRASANLQMSFVIVEANSATIAGAGIFVQGAKLTGDNLTIRLNSLPNGAEGAGIFVSDGSLELIGSTVSANTATNGPGEQSRGVGLMLRDSTSAVSQSSIDGNRCTDGDCLGIGIAIVGTLSLTDVDVDNNTSTDSPQTIGVGVYSFGSELTFVEGSVSDNTATTSLAMAAYLGGGLYAADSLVLLERIHVARNVLRGDDGGSFGAGIYSGNDSKTSRITIRSSSIEDNESTSVAGIASGAGITVDGNDQTAEIVLRDSSVVNNAALGNTSTGGGLYIFGKAGQLASAQIINSTISGNTIDGGAGANGAGLGVFQATLDIRHVTITDNRFVDSPTQAGGGLFVFSGTATLANSILARNVGNRADCDASNALFIQLDTASIISDADCRFTGTPTIVDPLLAPLVANGGVGLTHLPQSTSPAINSGSGLGCLNFDNSMLTLDQRGLARDGQCDVGAVEVQ